VQSDSGESCEGIPQRALRVAGAFVALSECTITFATSGATKLRAEHFGDDVFGYSSSAPAQLTIAPAMMFKDGFE
jgi:hypothetical protein